MKVLLVNTYDTGGAAQACIRLHLALLQQGISSKLLLLHQSNSSIPESFQFKPVFQTPSNLQRVVNRIKRIFGIVQKSGKDYWYSDLDVEIINLREPTLEYFSYPKTRFDITSSKLYQDADIVNLHWVSNFIDWQTFFSKNTKPIVWTLHDQNPFLGGEHYIEKIIGLDQFNNPIQRKMSETELEYEKEMSDYKNKALQKLNNSLNLVCPSKWILQQSELSRLFSKFFHTYIPYGLDGAIFKPLNKVYSRNVLSLPQNKLIILFVSDNVQKVRKGFAFLQQAIKLLKFDRDIKLCAVGNFSNDKNSKLDICYLGEIENQRMMSVIYSAADLFVIPSLEDNLPNTVLESLMCGTPVIGFPTGGIPEMIDNESNGVICKGKGVNELRDGIVEAIKRIDSFDQHRIASNAFAKYDHSMQAKRYIDLFISVKDANLS